MASVLSAIILVTFLGLSLAADEGFVVPSIEFKPITKLADDIPTCRQKDSDINECIRQGFQQLTPRLKNGISDLNIPPMDPFLLGKSSYNYNSGILQGRIAMRNVLVHGLSEGIVDKVDYRQKTNRVRMDMLSHVPQLLAEGAYKADIKLNDMKITPKGTFNITLTDVSMKTRALGELYERDGHTYLRLTKLETEPKVGDMRIYANGLVPDPALNDVILDFINQYWQQLYQAMLPETMAIWEPILLKVGNDFFAALPFDLIVTKD
ncbi:uncharacterized protein LOC115763385 [Drosophila novamexicana]|uniref:uncharacterized protein LOC115763385 n=1 Tax=Drosophila novamexicana TaxID=47314 RepID=UPI0011E5AA79|nr:uncharacterized protein LOC115763385 [Drosophila novamexicana]